MSTDQEPYEHVTRVFWIKIELKENTQNGKQVFGEIRDVIDGKKSPIDDLFDIINFIIPYMEEMSIPISWFWRLVNWLKEIRKTT